MAVRKTHNRVKTEPMGKDLDEIRKKAKTFHKGYGEFFIRVIKSDTNGDTYYSSIHNNLGSEPIEHWKNVSGYGERVKWIQIK